MSGEENKEIGLKKDLTTNYLPTPPTKHGRWRDKRDHDKFQFIVSGQARKEGEKRFYDSQTIKPKAINKEVVTKKI